MPRYQSKIISVGSFLPKKLVTNDDLAKFVDTSDEWIVKRTGIKQRYFADGMTTSQMAVKAAKDALNKVNFNVNSIDTIILATSTPDLLFPSTAIKIQKELGIKKAIAFDIEVACSGFLYALNCADNLIRLAKSKNVLVIASEVMSSILNFKDRSTCVLFGDGAGCALLCRTNSKDKSGIKSINMASYPQFYDDLLVNGGPGSNQKLGHIVMNGRNTYIKAVEFMVSEVNNTMRENNITIDELDFIVPHQANKRIMDAISKKLNFPSEKIPVVIDKTANTSAATVPIALCSLFDDNKLQSGDKLVLVSMGAGYTSASSFIIW